MPLPNGPANKTRMASLGTIKKVDTILMSQRVEKTVDKSVDG
jgi:hypothetical protein